MNIDIFSAPLTLQLAFGGGYLGYIAAYAGIRDHHRQIDVAFLTVAFGLAATVCFNLTEPRIGELGALGSSIILVVTIGLLWRQVGRKLVRFMLKRGHLSYSDDDPSVLTTLFADTHHHVSQVTVVMDNGNELYCENTASFEDAPIAPFIYGADGSVALYVTHIYKKQQDGSLKSEEQEEVRNSDWGDNLTIVPANRVQQVDLRLRRRT